MSSVCTWRTIRGLMSSVCTWRTMSLPAANVAGDSVAHHFRHRTPGHCQHRRAARHSFDHHQSEGLVPLNWEQHGQGVAQEFVLRIELRQPYVLHEVAVHLRLDFLLEVFAVHRLHIVSDLQRDPSTLGNLDGEVSALD